MSLEENKDNLTEDLQEIKEEIAEEKSNAADQAKWYVINTLSSYEDMVKRNILTMAENSHLKDYIFDVRVLTEEEVVEKDGKKKVVERKKFPSYVFIKMIYTQEVWYNIVNTRGVTSFVGGKGRPTPLTEEEVRLQKLEVFDIQDIDVEVGDTVVVMSGALATFIGVVQEINNEQQKVKVAVSLFGRETPVELGFGDIEKV